VPGAGCRLAGPLKAAGFGWIPSYVSRQLLSVSFSPPSQREQTGMRPIESDDWGAATRTQSRTSLFRVSGVKAGFKWLGHNLRAVLLQEPSRELRSQVNDSIDDHSYMGFDGDGVGSMICHDFVHIWEWLAGKATCFCE
jgi:hypothetical protein